MFYENSSIDISYIGHTRDRHCWIILCLRKYVDLIASFFGIGFKERAEEAEAKMLIPLFHKCLISDTRRRIILANMYLPISRYEGEVGSFYIEKITIYICRCVDLWSIFDSVGYWRVRMIFFPINDVSD